MLEVYFYPAPLRTLGLLPQDPIPEIQNDHTFRNSICASVDEHFFDGCSIVVGIIVEGNDLDVAIIFKTCSFDFYRRESNPWDASVFLRSVKL